MSIVDDEKYRKYRRHMQSLGKALWTTSQGPSRYEEDFEMIEITCICKNQASSRDDLSPAKIQGIMKGLTRNKPADIHGLTVDHFLHAGPETQKLLQNNIKYRPFLCDPPHLEVPLPPIKTI